MSDTTTTTEPQQTQQTTQGDPAAAADPATPAKKRWMPSAPHARKPKSRPRAAPSSTRINRANESALERRSARRREAAENAKTAAVAAFREAAVKFGGITAEDAELFLTGTDAETLSKQAARLVERASDDTKPGPGPTSPQGAKEFATSSGTPGRTSRTSSTLQLT